MTRIANGFLNIECSEVEKIRLIWNKNTSMSIVNIWLQYDVSNSCKNQFLHLYIKKGIMLLEWAPEIRWKSHFVN